MRAGDWVQCESCGEESIWIWRDASDFCCSCCGGGAPMTDAESSTNVAFLADLFHSM